MPTETCFHSTRLWQENFVIIVVFIHCLARLLVLPVVCELRPSVESTCSVHEWIEGLRLADLDALQSFLSFMKRLRTEQNLRLFDFFLFFCWWELSYISTLFLRKRRNDSPQKFFVIAYSNPKASLLCREDSSWSHSLSSLASRNQTSKLPFYYWFHLNNTRIV